jgi:hypothetical protein
MAQVVFDQKAHDDIGRSAGEGPSWRNEQLLADSRLVPQPPVLPRPTFSGDLRARVEAQATGFRAQTSALRHTEGSVQSSFQQNHPASRFRVEAGSKIARRVPIPGKRLLRPAKARPSQPIR